MASLPFCRWKWYDLAILCLAMAFAAFLIFQVYDIATYEPTLVMLYQGKLFDVTYHPGSFTTNPETAFMFEDGTVIRVYGRAERYVINKVNRIWVSTRYPNRLERVEVMEGS